MSLKILPNLQLQFSQVSTVVFEQSTWLWFYNSVKMPIRIATRIERVVFGRRFCVAAYSRTLVPLPALCTPRGPSFILFLCKKLRVFSFHLLIQILNRCGTNYSQCYASEINHLTNCIQETTALLFINLFFCFVLGKKLRFFSCHLFNEILNRCGSNKLKLVQRDQSFNQLHIANYIPKHSGEGDGVYEEI